MCAKNLISVTNVHHWPSIKFSAILSLNLKQQKNALTVSPKHFGQIWLPWASISLMTSFHHSQFHCSTWMEVGQILGNTFPNVSKIHYPWPLQLQKCNRKNMTPKQKWPHMTQDILGKTLTWSQIMTCVTSTHNSPSTNFLPIWLATAACHKMECTLSPNHLGQI